MAETEFTGKDGTIIRRKDDLMQYNFPPNKEPHICVQGSTLAVINEKLDRIELDIKDVKQHQVVYLQSIDSIRITTAKFPQSDEMYVYLRKIDKHETYFAIILAALGLAWGVLLIVLQKLWV